MNLIYMFILIKWIGGVDNRKMESYCFFKVHSRNVAFVFTSINWVIELIMFYRPLINLFTYEKFSLIFNIDMFEW